MFMQTKYGKGNEGNKYFVSISDSGRVKARKKTKEGAPESYFIKAGSKNAVN